jgi:putative addiction module killer protein
MDRCGETCPSSFNDNVYVIIAVLHVREYVDTTGRSPFTKWLRALNVQAAAKVATALERIAAGNLSNVKTVGSGVLEYRVEFGPGYRIYFGRDGDRLVILLAGGTKKRQQQDIRQAKVNWEDYRSRKTEE